MEQTFGTATPRQRWALYCITKKDYREVNISKEEASKIIEKFGKKSTLEEELLTYLKDNFNEIFEYAGESLKIRSVIEDDPDFTDKPKKYAFIGVGCGITYPKYHKSKGMESLMNAAHNYRRNEIKNLFIKQFTDKERKYYKTIGCPLEAIWEQDQQIQQGYWYVVKRFCESKGKHVDIISHLD